MSQRVKTIWQQLKAQPSVKFLIAAGNDLRLKKKNETFRPFAYFIQLTKLSQFINIIISHKIYSYVTCLPHKTMNKFYQYCKQHFWCYPKVF